MAKPVQFFALVRSFHFRHNFIVLAVTSEKGGQVYGREVPGDLVTHVAARDVLHRFPSGTTLEYAAGARDRAKAAFDRLQPEIEAARHRVENLQSHQRASVLDAAKFGSPPKAAA